jgi:hypothetical protein
VVDGLVCNLVAICSTASQSQAQKGQEAIAFLGPLFLGNFLVEAGLLEFVETSISRISLRV